MRRQPPTAGLMRIAMLMASSPACSARLRVGSHAINGVGLGHQDAPFQPVPDFRIRAIVVLLSPQRLDRKDDAIQYAHGHGHGQKPAHRQDDQGHDKQPKRDLYFGVFLWQ
jgi:hypothetical protein